MPITGFARTEDGGYLDQRPRLDASLASKSSDESRIIG